MWTLVRVLSYITWRAMLLCVFPMPAESFPDMVIGASSGRRRRDIPLGLYVLGIDGRAIILRCPNVRHGRSAGRSQRSTRVLCELEAVRLSRNKSGGRKLGRFRAVLAITAAWEGPLCCGQR
jgi:hypothetical protein